MSGGPIVIGSSPSSGSTLLRTVLGRLPGVVSGGEIGALDRPHLFAADAETLRTQFDRWVRKSASRPFVTGMNRVFARCEQWGWEQPELIEMGSSAGSWPEVLQRFFERAGGDRWLEKTPGNVYAFGETRAAFPDVQLIHLVRDGRDAAASVMRRGASPFLAVSRWLCAAAAGLEHPDAYELRYEALVREPSVEVERLCAYLGERFDEALLAGDDAAAPALGSWSASAGGAITTAAIGSYRDGDVETLLAHLGGVRLVSTGESGLELLQRLGYDERATPRALTAAEIAAAETELDEYVRREEQRHGVCLYPPPTRVR